MDIDVDMDFFGSQNWYRYGAESDQRRILIVE
jgi:hypothetical protein